MNKKALTAEDAEDAEDAEEELERDRQCELAGLPWHGSFVAILKYFSLTYALPLRPPRPLRLELIYED